MSPAENLLLLGSLEAVGLHFSVEPETHPAHA